MPRPTSLSHCGDVAVGVEDPFESFVRGGLHVGGDVQDLFEALALVLALGEAETGLGDPGERLGPAPQRLFGDRVTHDSTLTTP